MWALQSHNVSSKMTAVNASKKRVWIKDSDWMFCAARPTVDCLCCHYFNLTKNNLHTRSIPPTKHDARSRCGVIVFQAVRQVDSLSWVLGRPDSAWRCCLRKHQNHCCSLGAAQEFIEPITFIDIFVLNCLLHLLMLSLTFLSSSCIDPIWFMKQNNFTTETIGI